MTKTGAGAVDTVQVTLRGDRKQGAATAIA